MPRRKAPEELTEEELRRLLIEKRRGARRDRIEHFRQTGRVVAVVPDLAADAAKTADSPPEAATPREVPRERRWWDRLLVGVEVLAVLAFIGVVLGGMGVLRDMNEIAFAPATIESTPNCNSTS
mgnify:CR=1 FL=1